MTIELKDLRVLVVEDSFQTIALIRTMLTDFGITQIYTAKDGKEALDFLGTCDELIDIVMCDWNMPRMSGLEVLRQVRTVDPDMPFLMVTGAADPDSVLAAKSNGVTAYIAKPFSANILKKKLNVVARLLSVRHG
ncbi:MAG: response regulator [Dongiaceae bacterium]